MKKYITKFSEFKNENLNENTELQSQMVTKEEAIKYANQKCVGLDLIDHDFEKITKI